MLIVSLLFMSLLSFGVAEFLGRRKHIGRWWTFTLSLTGFLVVGLVASFLSPSAKKIPTKGHIAHLIVGVLISAHGVLTFIMFSVQSEPVGISQAISFMSLGTYLIVLSRGKVVNDDPKFYFSFANDPKISSTFRGANNPKTSTPPTSTTDFLYYVREGEANSEPKTFSELKNLKIKENTPVWRKGLEKWVLAKELSELESIILQEPPKFEEPVEKVIEEKAQVVPPPFIEKENSLNRTTPPEFTTKSRYDPF